jgi:hypothetical protein
MDFSMETYIAAAQRHGENSEPDHEVGDLQQYLRIAAEIMTDEQRHAFARNTEVLDLVANAD